jgi:hypothetical protein
LISVVALLIDKIDTIGTFTSLLHTICPYKSICIGICPDYTVDNLDLLVEIRRPRDIQTELFTPKIYSPPPRLLPGHFFGRHPFAPQLKLTAKQRQSSLECENTFARLT